MGRYLPDTILLRRSLPLLGGRGTSVSHCDAPGERSFGRKVQVLSGRTLSTGS